MNKVNYQDLIENREKLISRQKVEWYNSQDEELNLHLGCGSFLLPGYINIDLANPKADKEGDLRHPDGFADNTVNKIVCHHALEHIPMRDLLPTLKNWYKLLKPGGTIDIGMPDIELCMKMFLEEDEERKWGWLIWTIYGAQTEQPTENNVYDIQDTFPYMPSQSHLSGLSLGKMIELLERVGFRMVEAYHYDGFGTPSFFIYAKKPEIPTIKPSALEQDTVMGTFTNSTKYISDLWKSSNEQLPNVQFITRFSDSKIVENMNLLRKDFVRSGKRYWIFLDHDIQFLNKDIVNNALKTMVRKKAGMVTVYMTGDTKVLAEEYGKAGLLEHQTTWGVGYFIMVDSFKVGDVLADINLPCHNTGIDISYSMDVKNKGYEIWASPDYVYHTKKYTKLDYDAAVKTHTYMLNRWDFLYENAIQPLKTVLD